MISVDENLEGYLSGLNISDDSKRKIRKAVKDFMPILASQGRAWPEESDYAAYEHNMQAENKSTGTIRDNLSRVRKFFAACDDNSYDNATTLKVHDGDDVKILIENEAPEQLAAKRFSLLIPPSMYSALEWLSQYDRCSVARVIIQACTAYVSSRQGDIDYIRDIMATLAEGIERRKSGNF